MSAIERSLLVMALSLLAFPEAAFGSGQDMFPPAQIADNEPPQPGQTPRCPAKFYFSSDVEDTTPGEITLNNLVRNDDTNDLVFKWQKAGKLRGIFNPLPPGAEDQDPHPIPGYEQEPDWNAPIEYTQASCERSAAVYKENTVQSTGSVDETLKSKLSTKFYDENKKVIDLNIEIHVYWSGTEVTYEILRNPSYLTVLLGGLDRPSMAEELADFVQQAIAQNAEATVTTLREFLVDDELAWVPDSFLSDTMLVLKPIEAGQEATKLYFKSPSVVEGTGNIAVFDRLNRLITTGKYSTFLSME